jgi:hypothetical protein
MAYYIILHCSILYYVVLLFSTLSVSDIYTATVNETITQRRNTMLYCIALHCTILYCIALHYKL